MAGQSLLSDVLKSIGFSELLEQFQEAEESDNVTALLSDSELIKKIVPIEHRDTFEEKVNEFFGTEKVNDDDGSEVNVDNSDSSEHDDLENVDPNNTGQRRPQNNISNQIYPIENVDIRAILKKTFEGRQILLWHESNSYLSPGRRTKLVYFLISGVMKNYRRRLKSSDFKVLSRKIVDVFPKECPLVYFEPGVSQKKSPTGKVKKPKGKLYNRYNNALREAFAAEALKAKPVVTNETIEPPSEDVQNSIEWLKTQEEPWNEAVQHWINTLDYRQEQIENEYKNKIANVFEEWPILRCPKGYLLILQEFSLRKFTNNADAIKNFKEFFDIARLAKPLKKDEHCDLFKNMLENESLKEDDRVLIQLMLLCIMVPSAARVPIGRKKRWKPSAVESLEGIVTRIKIDGDIEQVKADRHQFALLKNITVQPYIIVVEDDDYSVNSTYLCIDDILYAMTSFLGALDACFKSFHVFNARYTVQSEQIWLMLQLGLYKFRTKWDNSIIGVNEILNDMGCLLPLLEQ